MAGATNSTKRGVDVLIQVQIASTWTTVAGQRGATLSEEAETVEITSKSSPGQAKEYEYGYYGWKISLNGVHDKAGAGYSNLRDALRNKTKVQVQVLDAGSTLGGLALVTSCEYDAPHDGEQTYSIELLGTGALTNTP